MSAFAALNDCKWLLTKFCFIFLRKHLLVLSFVCMPIYAYSASIEAMRSWHSEIVQNWPLPPPTELESIPPDRIIDFSRLTGAAQEAFMLANGKILLTGYGAKITENAISLLDPVSGEITHIFEISGGGFRNINLSKDRKFVWFMHWSVNKPDRLYLIDLVSAKVFSLADAFGKGRDLLENAMLENHYWKSQIEPDGRLLIEWGGTWADIANWWDRTPVDWRMETPLTREQGNRKVYSRAYLSSPEKWFRQDNRLEQLEISFDVSYNNILTHEDIRPAPTVTEDGRHFAPIYVEQYYSKLISLPMPTFGLNVQLYNLYRNPETMGICGSATSSESNDDIAVWSSVSNNECARFQGAYVEQAIDGKLIHTLNHGVGVPTASVIHGRLFAMSGLTDRMKPAYYVSVWDALTGKLLAHLNLPNEAVRNAHPASLLFSDDTQELFCLTSYPKAKLYVWKMKAEWQKIINPNPPAPKVSIKPKSGKRMRSIRPSQQNPL